MWALNVFLNTVMPSHLFCFLILFWSHTIVDMYFPLSWVELESEWLAAVVPATDSAPTKLFLSPLMVFVFGICSFIRPFPGALSCSSSNSSSHSPWVNLLSVQISSPPLSQYTALIWTSPADQSHSQCSS